MVEKSEDVILDKVRDLNDTVDNSVRRIESVFRDRIQHFKELKNSFQKHFWLYIQKMEYYKKDIGERSERLVAGLKNNLMQANDKINNLKNLLKSFNPERVLARGYSMTLSADGKVIKSSSDITINETVTTKLSKGKFDSKITKKE